jgi:hypothetical protein
LTSGLGEMIDQLSKMQQGRGLDPRLWMHDHRRASRTIEHPARDHDSQFSSVGSLLPTFHPHQHRRLAAIAGPPQHGHIVIEERVKTINNLRWTKLAGSVWIR